MTTSSDIVLYEKRDRIGWVTINRPEAMNALNPDVGAGLTDAFEEVANDDDVLVAILTGAGGRAFSAGMDLKWRASEDASSGVQMGGGGRGSSLGLEEVGACPKPVIAAIDGYALAGGFQTAARCDVRVATEQSRFGMLEARRALAAVGSFDTPEMVAPPGEAAWILLTGGMMKAERAYDIGLIQALLPDRDALFEEAENIAGEMKLCAPLALRAIKATLRTKKNMPTPPEGVRELDHLKKLNEEVQRVNAESEDRLEGPLAFAEKRDAVWKNR